MTKEEATLLERTVNGWTQLVTAVLLLFSVGSLMGVASFPAAAVSNQASAATVLSAEGSSDCFESALRLFPAPIFVWSDRDGRILWANRAFDSWVGVSEGSSAGKKASELPICDLGRLSCVSARSGPPPWELGLSFKGASQREVRSRVWPVRWRGGRSAVAVVLLVDSSVPTGG